MFDELLRLRERMREANVDMRTVLPFAINPKQATEIINSVGLSDDMRFVSATRIELMGMKFVIVEDNGHI